MNSTFKAIETTGRLDEHNRIILDEPISVKASQSVKVVILFEDEEIDEQSWMNSAAVNPAFEFLKEKKEDIYTAKDGKPFNDKK